MVDTADLGSAALPASEFESRCGHNKTKNIMENHEGNIRGYIRCSKAYYAELHGNTIEVTVGMYAPDGGTSGEFMFEWVDLSGVLYPRLKAFDDSWSALWMFQDLLQAMSGIDDEGIQEPEFCQLLDSLGISDMTKYKAQKVEIL